MAKLNWQRVLKKSNVETSDYWNKPAHGFDKEWHNTQAQKQAQQDRLIRDKAMAMIKANKNSSRKVSGPVK
jgi:hypothetical protein